MNSLKDATVQVYCTNGHAQRLWGNPLMARPGERVRFWGSDLRCGHGGLTNPCNTPCYGGGHPR